LTNWGDHFAAHQLTKNPGHVPGFFSPALKVHFREIWTKKSRPEERLFVPSN
jgi:hypothetical protein